MTTTIKLKLSGDRATFAQVKELPGLAGLELDEGFGLVCVSGRQRLYCCRTDSTVDNVERRRHLSPEVLQFYGDILVEEEAST